LTCKWREDCGESRDKKISGADTICELPTRDVPRIMYDDNIKHDVRHVGLDYIYWNDALITQKCRTIQLFTTKLLKTNGVYK
jgi:hypothetical protein